ncbi:hypothetical protein [Paraburkholderia caledonica]|uniref:hypothetical protein n=1 Tax=Paraburkholderia caledonica TaxID=134536 RepID=UPI0038BC675D
MPQVDHRCDTEFLPWQYFAHARLLRASLDDGADVEMRIEHGIGWFDTENEAIEAAQQWAFG